MPKNKGLGRGLDAIYLDNSLPEEENKANDRRTVPVSQIDVNADQPRKTFAPDALAELAESIRRNGLLQPVLVRRTMAERYEIIARERRFRAAKLAGLTELPVIVLEADDATAARYALIENLQREDLNPYEEAAAYRALMERYSLTQEEVAGEVGRSRSAVANSLRLLELPEGAANMLRAGMLTAGHARTLLGLRDPEKIVPMAQDCVGKELSVRELEELVKAANRAGERKAPAKKAPEVDYVKTIAERFSGRTGRQCRIQYTKKKKTFQLEFRDNADLEAICRLLAGDDFFDEF